MQDGQISPVRILNGEIIPGARRLKIQIPNPKRALQTALSDPDSAIRSACPAAEVKRQ